MDACSRDARDELIAWFCDRSVKSSVMQTLTLGVRVLICDVLARELEEYIKLFGTSEEAGRCHSPMIPRFIFFCILYIIFEYSLHVSIQAS